METLQIALGTRSAHIKSADLHPLAAALNKQARLHVAPIWTVSGQVTVLEDPERVPDGVSPIILMDQVPHGMHGVHTFANGLPYAVVLAADHWSLAVSHEFVEMLVDPTGSKTMPGRKMHIVDGVAQDLEDRVDYVLEVCDPVEDRRYAYKIDGVLVSDFYTPHYFDDVASANVRYSYSGKLKRPREVGPRGYLSWLDHKANAVAQMRLFKALEIVKLGSLPSMPSAGASRHLRSLVDRHSETPRIARMRQKPLKPAA
jgi:hypothetical protein